MSVGAALYWIDWQDLQVSTTTVNGNLPITGNGSEAESKGLELQSRLLLGPNLDMSFTYTRTNAKLTARAPGLVGPLDALAGARLPGHAEHQGAISLNYSTVWKGFDATFNYGIVYASDVFNIVGGNLDPLVDASAGDAPGDRGGEAIPGYSIHQMALTLARDNWSVQGYVDNLLDKYYITGTTTQRRFLADEVTGPGRDVAGWTLRSYGQYVGTPRTSGLRVNYDF